MQSFHDVSVIIVAGGNHPYLERCVRSCVAQTFPGRSYELLLLHDGQSGMVEDVVANYGRSQLLTSHFVESTPSAILTAAIRNSTGRFIIFVDPDDFISDYMVLFQTVFMYDNTAFGGVTVDYWLVDPESDRKIARVNGREKPILAGTMFRKDVLAKLTRSEGAALGYEPEALRDILMRNSNMGHLPISFYRRSAKADAG